MPRVNWSLSPEAKAVFDAYQRERGFKNQDEAINAMILEYEPPNGLIAVDSSGRFVKGRGAILKIATKDIHPAEDISRRFGEDKA